VADVIVASAANGGWQRGSPAGDGSYQLAGADLGAPCAVYTKKTGTDDWYAVEAAYYVPPLQMIDFNTDYELLGLSTGTAVQSQMDGRWSNATSTSFYLISGTVNKEGITFDVGACLSSDPAIGFGFNSSTSKLVISGTVTGESSASIKYDIAVIGAEGKGWLNGQDSLTAPMKTPGYNEPFPPGGRTILIPLSDLTAGNMTTSLESGYKIYIIVRELNGYPSTDYNTHTLGKTMNVIRVESYP
jgi:hypothetical protein